MSRRSKLEVGRSNMIQMGFQFRSGGHEAEDDWPIRCKPLPPRYRDGGSEGTYNGYVYIYDDQGKLWMSYPLEVTSRVRSPITYTLDYAARPIFDRTTQNIDALSLRTRDRWLANAWMGSRPASLRALPFEIRELPIRWHDDIGEIFLVFLVGQIADLLLDPVEVAGRRKRWQDYLKLPATRALMKAGKPTRFYERNLSDDEPELVKTVAQSKRPHVVWLPVQKNGFQHPDPDKTVYPEGVTRVALDNRPAIGSVLRLWGDPSSDINGIALQFMRMSKKGRWEAVLTDEDTEKIRI